MGQRTLGYNLNKKKSHLILKRHNVQGVGSLRDTNFQTMGTLGHIRYL